MTTTTLLTKPCQAVGCTNVIVKGTTTSLREWNKQTKYCSRECYWKSKVKPATKRCRQCGEVFKPRYWQTRAIYCSTRCSGLARQRGSKLTRRIYRLTEWKVKRDLVRLRDKVCQLCGAEPEPGTWKGFQVDHKTLRRVSHDDSFENLQLVCLSCHKRKDAPLLAAQGNT